MNFIKLGIFEENLFCLFIYSSVCDNIKSVNFFTIKLQYIQKVHARSNFLTPQILRNGQIYSRYDDWASNCPPPSSSYRKNE